MGCWVIVNQHGRLTLAFRYRGRQWKRSLAIDATAPGARRKAEALAVHCATLIDAGRLEVEYGRIFEGDDRFAPVRPAADDRGPLMRDWSQAVLAERQPPLYRRSYARALRSHLSHWIDGALGALRLSEIRREDVLALRQAVMATARKGKGGSQKYARNVLTSVRMLLSEAQGRGLVAQNVAAGLQWPRTARPDPDPLTRDEIEKALAYFRARDPYAYRFALCLADTGLRPSEAAALTWGDVELAGGGMIAVRQSRVGGRTGATKTAASRRTLRPVSARLVHVLRTVKPLHVEPATPVFTGRTGVQMRQERFTERKWLPALRACDIRPRRLYDVRATFISLALSAAANPQWLAEYTGTSLDMFQRHYARFLPAADGAALLGHIPGGAEGAAPMAKVERRLPEKGRRHKG